MKSHTLCFHYRSYEQHEHPANSLADDPTQQKSGSLWPRAQRRVRHAEGKFRRRPAAPDYDPFGAGRGVAT